MSIKESIRRILREETSLKTDIKDMISKHGFFITSKMLGGVDTMNSIINIKGSQEEMIFIVKAIMEHDIEVLINVCNYQIIPTIHSFKLYVEIPKYYPNHSDDYFPNKQKTFEARDYISDLIKKFGNGKVRGYNIYVQIGNC
jgi:aspartate/methionine/tyrosine aminotransferase